MNLCKKIKLKMKIKILKNPPKNNEKKIILKIILTQQNTDLKPSPAHP